MAIALVSNVKAAGANTFTSGSIDTSGANLLTVVLTEASVGAATLSDSKGNTWTACTEQFNSVNPACVIYYAKNPTVGTGHTFTATGTSHFAVISAAAWSGADTAAPLDQQNGTGGAGFVNTAPPGSVTPTEDNELVLSGFAWASSVTITSVTGSTILDQTDFAGGTNYGGGDAYVIQTAATAINPAWNFTGTIPGNVVVATFKVGAAGLSPRPSLFGHGTAAFTATNAATIAPALPTGWAANDIHILIAHRSDNTAMTALTGWTNIASLTGNNTTAQRVEVWWRRAVAGDTAPTVTFGSSTIVRGAFIIGVRNVDPNELNPFHLTSRLDNAAAATISFTDLTTTLENCLIIAAGAYEDDPTTITTMTNYTQASGAVQGSSLGTDMMLCYEYRTLASPGAAGASSVTVSGGTFANSPSVGLMFAIKPYTMATELAGRPFGLRGQAQMMQLLSQ